MDNTKKVVKEEVTTPEVSETTEPVVEVPEETPTPATQAGDKTAPNQLLDSLQKERTKRKDLEKELEELKLTSSAQSDEVFSDEGKALAGQIKSLERSISSLKQDSTKKDIIIKSPVLKDKWAEFEEFRADPENKGMNMRTAAKAFLVENGLYETPRKGLEKPTGGDRKPAASGMTTEDVKNLRETNYKKYQELLMKGQINIQ